VPGLIGGSVIFESIFAIPDGATFLYVCHGSGLPGCDGDSLNRGGIDAAGEPDCRRVLCPRRPKDQGFIGVEMGTDFWKRFKKNKIALAGSCVVILLFVVSIFAPVIAPYDPDEINLKLVLAPPSASHLCGTDQLGRDVFSRMVWGSRISLKVGFVATGIAILIGAILGAVAGYYGRWTDRRDYEIRRHHALLSDLLSYPCRDCAP